MTIRVFQELIGKTFTEVASSSEDLLFASEDGGFKFYHDQGCCESVMIESIDGSLADLVGSPILMAEEVSSDPVYCEGHPQKNCHGSETWTFYKFASEKGHVTVRWYGTSNGYYSERVSFDSF